MKHRSTLSYTHIIKKKSFFKPNKNVLKSIELEIMSDRLRLTDAVHLRGF